MLFSVALSGFFFVIAWVFCMLVFTPIIVLSGGSFSDVLNLAAYSLALSWLVFVGMFFISLFMD